MTVNRKDAVTGGIFILCGSFFAIHAATQLSMGTALRMGPGYFPLLLGCILVAVGLATAVRSIGRPGTPIGNVSWRAVGLIGLAPVLFGLTLSGLGLVPATALTVIVSSFASRRTSILFAAVLSIGLTVFCVLLFRYGLGLQLRPFGPWIAS